MNRLLEEQHKAYEEFIKDFLLLLVCVIIMIIAIITNDGKLAHLFIIIPMFIAIIIGTITILIEDSKNIKEIENRIEKEKKNKKLKE